MEHLCFELEPFAYFGHKKHVDKEKRHRILKYHLTLRLQNLPFKW